MFEVDENKREQQHKVHMEIGIGYKIGNPVRMFMIRLSLFRELAESTGALPRDFVGKIIKIMKILIP